MPATIIDGKRIAAEIREEVRKETETLKAERGITPGLAFILVGENPSSQLYVSMKGKACAEAGIYSVTERYEATFAEDSLLKRIAELNTDPAIHGILVQLPLPSHINEQRVIESIDPRKDVDGFHPMNVGKLAIGFDTFKSCTPWGVQELLMRSGNPPAGKHVVIAGRSNIVGKPMAMMLMQKKPDANAVVTIAHTGAADIATHTKTADILIAAIGKPEFITGAMLKEGAVVIDVGINTIPDPSHPKGSRTVGDVHFESASKVAKAITPVPGGVGPMTIAMLLKNTLKAARAFAS